MRPSFQVVLAIIAALTVSMTVSADTECHTAGRDCEFNYDCCRGYRCNKEIQLCQAE
ncbi:hypothetical protein BDR07DRAFT_1398273 [Suillus spraguei]|nr:hypothetical protein BDR07DRAFT_1398273 [Suillus spraguei]